MTTLRGTDTRGVLDRRGFPPPSSLTVALLGRPNVGKSTLANRLSGKWDALVSPVPGFTRDRRDVDVEWRGRALRLIDMGGWVEVKDPRETLAPAVRRQILQGLGQADLVLLVMDVRDGLMAADRALADLARRSGRPCVIAVNAVDNAEKESSAAEFAALGFQHVVPVSALHGRNSDELLDAILVAAQSPSPLGGEGGGEGSAVKSPRIAIVGRPNSGKSSLVNALLGEDRMVVDAAPGTTRDPIDSPWGSFTLVDTAGIRRAGMKGAPPRDRGVPPRITTDDLLRAEHLCVMMAERAIERADAALLLVDAAAGWSDVDARIGGLIREAGAACGILYTKWDLVREKTRTAGDLEQERRSRVPFLDWAPSLAVSATASVHLDEVPPLCAKVVRARAAQLDLRRLEETLTASLDRRPIVQHGHPVEIAGVRQSGACPPEITVILKRRGGGAGKARPGRPARGPSLHFSQIRFLERAIRQVFDLAGTPLRVRTVAGEAPHVGDRL